jgi:hypothetical protein
MRQPRALFSHPMQGSHQNAMWTWMLVDTMARIWGNHLHNLLLAAASTHELRRSAPRGPFNSGYRDVVVVDPMSH